MLVLFELMRKIKAILTQLCSLCTAKNRFWLNRSRETCQNEWSVLTFDDKGLSYIQKASDMPMTKKKLFLIILNNIVYHTFFVSPMSFNKENLSIKVQCLYFSNQ